MYTEYVIFGAFGLSDQGFGPGSDMIQVCTRTRDFGGGQDRRWGGEQFLRWKKRYLIRGEGNDRRL